MTIDLTDTIQGVIESRATKPFLIDAGSGRSLTYSQSHDLATRMARGLRRVGVDSGHRVALCLPNSVEFALLYLACLYLGAVVVPLNPALGRRDLGHVLELGRPRVLIHDDQTAGLLEAVLDAGPNDQRETARPTMVNVGLLLEDGPAAGADDWRPLAGVSADDHFSLTFTSGTTSRPKGVVHRIGSLIQSARAFNTAVGLGPEARLFHILPMAYMAGFLNTILCPFLAGGTVVLGPAFNVKLALRFWEAPMAHGVNTLWLAPTILATLLKADRSRAGIEYCRRSVNLALVGTAPLPVSLKDDFEVKYDVPLLESYGLSETLFLTTNTLTDGPVAGAVGRPLPGVELEALTEPGPDAEAAGGEIMIRAPWLMAGYLDPATGRPDPLEPGAWFASGDYGRVGDHGLVYITGRKKDLIIKGGVNLSPRAVEEVLLEHEEVEEVAVVGRAHDFYGEEPVAVLVLRPGIDLASVEPELKALCRRDLSELQAPGAYLAWEDLPKSVTGKVQKAVIRRRLAEGEGR